MTNNQHGFAKREMNRCGWSEGKGLGKTEGGMKDAIKVKMKSNKGGLGHDQSSEFTFHWWDHIFNKAANSFKVSEGEEGALIEKCEGKKITPFLICNKKPLSSKFSNASLKYGTFVKAGTYHADNKELPDSLTDNDSSDESSDDNEEITVNDTLEKTFKKTGLTGHKAARHGFKLSGKLQRLQNQEETQSSDSVEHSQGKINNTAVNSHLSTIINEETSTNKSSKHIKVESDSKLDEKETCEASIQVCHDDTPKKKTKKNNKASGINVEEEGLSGVEKSCFQLSDKEESKHTKGKRHKQSTKLNTMHTLDANTGTCNNDKPKKKKKKNKEIAEVEQLSREEKNVCKSNHCINEDTTEVKKGKHKLKKEINVLEDQPKPKKKKKSKNIKEEF